MNKLLVLPTLASALSLTTALGAGESSLPKWEAGMGVGAITLADYPGADQRRTIALPVPYFVYRGERFRADRNGLRARLVDLQDIDLDLSLSASAPVKSEKNAARRGMSDLDATLELGPQLILHLTPATASTQLDLRLPIRLVYAVNKNGFDSIGSVFSPALNLNVRNIQGSAWHYGLNIGPSFSTGAYNRYYYSVATEFATANRPAYQARAGYSGTQFTTTLSQREGRWWYGGFLRLNALQGAAFRDSPLVRRPSAWSAGLGFAYIFAESSERIDASEEP